MRSITRRLAGVALVGHSCLTWGANTDRDVGRGPGAQAESWRCGFTPGPMARVTRKRCELAAGTMINARAVEFNRAPAGRFSDWHVGPRRQFVVTLSGLDNRGSPEAGRSR